MKEKEASKLYNSITNVDNQFIEKAQTKLKKKMNGWLKWGAMAACLAIAVTIGTLIPRQTTNPTTPNDDPNQSNHSGELAIETSNLNIYYLSENGTIESKSVELNCIPKDIFNEWAALNNISDVTLVDCVYDNGGTETVQGGVVEHTNGNYFTLTITLSSGFSMYAESENGDLLIEALRQTFYDYIYFDEFNLNIL